MTSSNRTRTDLDLDVVVVLADPRLENPYHASEAQKEHDDQDVTHLREVMGALLDEERVTYLDDHDRLIDDLRQCRADVVLNFCNAGFRNQTDLQKNVPALLEMLGLRYAGADAGCLAICHDKAGVNAAAKRSGIPVARQEVVRLGADGDLPTQYPAVLKPNEAAGSMGITTGSVVHDQEQAARRLDELAQESVDTKWVVAEEFLDGREFSVAVLGSVDPDQPPSCLPPVEIDFSRLPGASANHDARFQGGSGIALLEPDRSTSGRALGGHEGGGGGVLRAHVRSARLPRLRAFRLPDGRRRGPAADRRQRAPRMGVGGHGRHDGRVRRPRLRGAPRPHHPQRSEQSGGPPADGEGRTRRGGGWCRRHPTPADASRRRCVRPGGRIGARQP